MAYPGGIREAMVEGNNVSRGPEDCLVEEHDWILKICKIDS